MFNLLNFSVWYGSIKWPLENRKWPLGDRKWLWEDKKWPWFRPANQKLVEIGRNVISKEYKRGCIELGGHIGSNEPW